MAELAFCKTAPDLIRIVESSRRAELRDGGRVPYQPWVAVAGSVRCKFRRALGVGIKGGGLSVLVDDLGRKEAKMVSELKMP